MLQLLKLMMNTLLDFLSMHWYWSTIVNLASKNTAEYYFYAASLILLGIITIVYILAMIQFLFTFDKKKSRPKRSMKWQRLMSASKRCAVCSNKGAETQTECKHEFHIYCLANCVKIKKVCPSCYKKIKEVKYFCQKCQKSYMFVDIQSKEEVESFRKSSNNQVCQSCK